MFEGLRTPMDLVVIVVTLLSYGCPIQAIVHVFGLDERTGVIEQVCSAKKSISILLNKDNSI
jgi:hypothetical protein